MLRTYHGSCHCGAIAFEVDLDLEAGTGKCNCSICTKRRKWGINVKPDAFRLLSGKDMLSDYQFGTLSGHHRFCRNCGCSPFEDGNVAEIGGDYVSISINCLDDASPEEMANAPIKYANGRDNLWWEEPAVTAYL